MVAAKRGKKFLVFMLLVVVTQLFLTEEVEARGRRRRVFGRPNRVANRGARNRGNRNFNNFVASNGGFNFNRFNDFNRFRRFDDRVNINDPFALGRFPIDLSSSLTLDPTGSVQRLSVAPDIGVDRFGNFFELEPGEQFRVRQRLACANSQCFGGQSRSVLPSTLSQMQLVNQSGNFDTVTSLPDSSLQNLPGL